eukprot:2163635-Pleurochrysis_carterae.AAC.2
MSTRACVCPRACERARVRDARARGLRMRVLRAVCKYRQACARACVCAFRRTSASDAAGGREEASCLHLSFGKHRRSERSAAQVCAHHASVVHVGPIEDAVGKVRALEARVDKGDAVEARVLEEAAHAQRRELGQADVHTHAHVGVHDGMRADWHARTHTHEHALP